MQRLRNTFEAVFAAFIFFTRLPFWRLCQPSAEAYRRVVEWWPLVGWLTGGVMASVLYWGSLILPYSIAVLLAIVARILLTGALHEDGLADFFDGFGGGTTRERILAIMKDSHIGTYGVLALILYFGLLFACLFSLPPLLAALAILVIDPYAKMLSAQFVSMLSYARNEDTAKSKVVYRRPSLLSGVSLAFQGLLPMAIALFLVHSSVLVAIAGTNPDSPLLISQIPFSVIYVPALVMYFLFWYVRNRLGGYTGDCCGAVFLLVELSAYLVVVSTI